MSSDNDLTSAPNSMIHAIPARPFSVAIDPVALVITECITVTSAMRKHARWAHSSVAAILGGASRQTPADRRSNHDRIASTESATLVEEDGLLTGRWGLRGKKPTIQDNPLLAAFARLRSDLKSCKDIKSFETAALLQPFMQVIRSSSTTAPITSLALIAITKMLAYNIIGVDSPNFAYGMHLLSSTVTHCRFEADNTSTDEVVFLRILKLMEIMITGPSGDVLGDQSVCEMMECGLSLCCHLKTTEVLRRSAEISMVTMCQTIFQRLRYLDLEAEGDMNDLEEPSAADMESVKIDSTVNREAPGLNKPTDRHQVSMDAARNADPRPSEDVNGSRLEISNPDLQEDPTQIRPYSLPSIRELFRVLSDLLDPFDRQHTDTMRVMALRIVNVALEVAGPSIACQPTLAALAKDTVCRNLFQLVRSENLAILHESLRVAGTLLATCRNVLKLQQELYLSYVVTCLHPRVPIPDEPSIDPALYEGVPQAPRLSKPAPGGTTSGRSTPVPVKDRQRLGMEGGSRKPDARESMIESVGALIRIPSFMAELFVNFDCDVERGDLCQDMVGLLSRNAFPDAATWSTTNVPPLCLDSLLTYIQFIADRLDDEPATEGLPDPDQLREQRARKRVIIKGAARFNENAKAGLAYLASQSIIQDANDPKSIAKFLRGTTRLDKKVLGEFLSKKQNAEYLEAFLDLFDFEGQRVDEALRQLLITFRLPGESQLIERILTTFSEKYCANALTDEVADKDAVFVLTYAIIMLNTDQHNPIVKKSQTRMTVDDFARNLRGVNGGKDFDREYLQNIYESIRTQEIVLPEEHDDKNAFEHAWKELLIKTQTTDDLVLCATNIYDAEMFAATWRPVVATLNYVFMSATDDTVFQRVIAGFDQCAQIASRYGLYDCLDHIIASLARISTLATEAPPSTALNTEVQAGGKSVMVSKFAVDFGRESKAELATLVLFRVINGHETGVRDGWEFILRIIINLFVNSMTSGSAASLSKSLDLQPIPLQSPAQVVARNDKSNETGLFSAFTSYVSSVMNDEPPEPNDQEIEATLTALDCISACKVEDIIVNIGLLPIDSLRPLMQSLLSMLPEDTSPSVIVVKSEVPAPTPVRPNGTRSTPPQPIYDPGLVYLLELATVVAIRDAETTAAFGQAVASALQSTIRDFDHLHPIATSRLSYYLLQLLRASNDHDFLRAPVILHTISSFSQDVQKSSAQNILKGIHECIRGPPGLRNEFATSPDFWSILHTLREFPDAAPLAFRIIEDIATGSPPAITADNYEPAISLLNAFAIAGSQSALKEQGREKANAARSGRGGRSHPQQQQQQTSSKERPARSDTVLRGVRGMTIVHSLSSLVPSLIQQSQLEPQAAWQAYWHPVFRCLSTQCVNPCREIRQQAFASLQRCLFARDLTAVKSDKKSKSEDEQGLQHWEWTDIFGGVLFPLINQLLKQETYSRDPQGMGEMRTQTAQVMCRIYLHYLGTLAEWHGLLELWKGVLGILERSMTASGTDERGYTVDEAIPESLKNVLLVMSTSGILVPPTSSDSSEEKESRTEQQQQIWAETQASLSRTLPGLLQELFPESSSEQAGKESGKYAGPPNTNTDAVNDGNGRTDRNPPRPTVEDEEHSENHEGRVGQGDKRLAVV